MLVTFGFQVIITFIFHDMTAAQFQQKYGHGHQASPPLPHAKPAKQTRALVGNHAGEARGTGCPRVRFTLCRVRLLDVDAKYGSIKDLLDGLQYANLLQGDREGEVTLEVIQERVSHYSEERTEIEIEYPEPPSTN